MLSDYEKQWQNRFSEMAKKGGKDHEISYWRKEGLENYLKYFFAYFSKYIKKDNSQVSLLDLGCGPGVFSRLLAEKGFKVYGVDYSGEMIKVAKERSEGKGIDFQAGDAYNLPFKEKSFDAVICLGIFQNLEDPNKALKEINRVLKIGGAAVITTLNAFSLAQLVRDEYSGLVKRYNPYGFLKLMKSRGFGKISLKGIYFSPQALSFITEIILKTKIYILFNLLFFIFSPFSHSFYIEARKVK